MVMVPLTKVGELLVLRSAAYDCLLSIDLFYAISIMVEVYINVCVYVENGSKPLVCRFYLLPNGGGCEWARVLFTF